MQISTRSTDYLVDVLAIREFVWELNEVFTDPSILKVLHGADMDIQWLQKDFGVYVVRASPPPSLVGQSLRHGPRGARAGLRVLRPRVSPQAVLRSDREQGVPARRLAVGVSTLASRQNPPLDAGYEEIRARRHAFPAVHRGRAPHASPGPVHRPRPRFHVSTFPR